MTGNILIVDPVPALRAVLRSKLEAAYFSVAVAASADETFREAETMSADVILLSADLGDALAQRLCRELKSRPAFANVPVIIIARPADNSLAEAFDAGADDVLTAPFEDAELCARVRNLVRVKQRLDELRLREDAAKVLSSDLDADPNHGGLRGIEPPCIGLLAFDPQTGADWQRVLLQAGFATKLLPEPSTESDFTGQTQGADMQLVIVGHGSEVGQNGLTRLSAMRRPSNTRNIPALIVLSHKDVRTAQSALDLGADDFAFAPLGKGEIVGRVRALLARQKKLAVLRNMLREGIRLSLIDPLTRVHNRRYALTALEDIRTAVCDSGINAAFMMLDLDRFKQVNDRFGHDAGDAVLSTVASRLSAICGERDLLARFGGEEFCVARMGLRSSSEAAELGEALRQAVESEPVRLPDGQDLMLTVSIGVSILEAPRPVSIAAALRQADEALYASKSAGRNCVRLHKTAA